MFKQLRLIATSESLGCTWGNATLIAVLLLFAGQDASFVLLGGVRGRGERVDLCKRACVCQQQGDTLEMVGDAVSGMARCPYDPKHANVALFAGK